MTISLQVSSVQDISFDKCISRYNYRYRDSFGKNSFQILIRDGGRKPIGQSMKNSQTLNELVEKTS